MSKNNFLTFLFTIIFLARALPLTAQTADTSPPTQAQLQELQAQIQLLQKEFAGKIAQLQEEIRVLKQEPRAQSAAIAGGSDRLLSPDQPQTELSAEEKLDQMIKAQTQKILPERLTDSLELDISAIIDGNYYHNNFSAGAAHAKGAISGFGHQHHQHHGHSHGDFSNGFNLRHIELGISAAVDPYFIAWTTLAFEDGEGVEVEEAVIQTSNLPYGLTLSAGRMMSGIGRLNRQHSHNWDFINTPLVYEKLLGPHGLIEEGLQLTWLAPTSFYLLLGTELANGENELLSNNIGGDELKDHDAPRMLTAFVKFGPELGQRQDLQFGLSYLNTRHQEAHDEDSDKLEDLWMDGRNQLYGTDFVYKYNAQREKGQGDIVLQGEYFLRKKSLKVKNSLFEQQLIGRHLNAWQDGYYLQATYGLIPRLRLGLRWEQVGITNKYDYPDGNDEKFAASERASAMLDWSFSEFSLFRFQLGRCNYHTHEGRKKAWELALQLQVSIGTHKAHDF